MTELRAAAVRNLSSTGKTGQLVVIIGVVLVIAVVAGYWLLSRQHIAAEYADALAVCEISNAAGDARIDALDRLYGEDARPRRLAMDLSLCRLRGATDRLGRARSILRNFDN